MTSRKKYVAPALSRYGSLAELTKNSGVKYGNDGQGMGCGEQKDTSCPR
ncbi:lasso RiPP family leader peptide-containing protein [Methylocystis sp. H62]|nr:lasso RiPP family leader peptide-containing protein [Methylocystis sp. H62]